MGKTIMNVAIELPPEIARSLAGPHEDLSRVTLEALADHGYRSGKLTHAEVQRMLGINSRWETDAFLKQAGAYLDYTEADLEHDLHGLAPNHLSPMVVSDTSPLNYLILPEDHVFFNDQNL